MNDLGTLVIKHIEPLEGDILHRNLTSQGQQQLHALLNSPTLKDREQLTIYFDGSSHDCEETARLIYEAMSGNGVQVSRKQIPDLERVLGPNGFHSTQPAVYIVTQQILDNWRTKNGVPEQVRRNIGHGEGYLMPINAAMRDFTLSADSVAS